MRAFGFFWGVSMNVRPACLQKAAERSCAQARTRTRAVLMHAQQRL
jgi:hypothetical protein